MDVSELLFPGLVFHEFHEVVLQIDCLLVQIVDEFLKILLGKRVINVRVHLVLDTMKLQQFMRKDAGNRLITFQDFRIYPNFDFTTIQKVFPSVFTFDASALRLRQQDNKMPGVLYHRTGSVRGCQDNKASVLPARCGHRQSRTSIR